MARPTIFRKGAMTAAERQRRHRRKLRREQKAAEKAALPERSERLARAAIDPKASSPESPRPMSSEITTRAARFALSRPTSHRDGPLGRDAPCPLSDEEISDWEPQLGAPTSRHPDVRAAREERLRAIVSDYYERARRWYRALKAPPNSPDPSLRVDKALPEIADCLEGARKRILQLPDEVTAAARVRYENYDLALTALGALPIMLKDIAATWHKPSRGQPKLSIEAEAVGLLIQGVELFTGEKLPSPRSEKRTAEFDFLRTLTSRLLPELTDKQFRTVLRHCQDSRQAPALEPYSRLMLALTGAWLPELTPRPLGQQRDGGYGDLVRCIILASSRSANRSGLGP
jgi:hypothetical protein